MNTQFSPYDEVVDNFESYTDIEDWFLEVSLIDKRNNVSLQDKEKYFKEIIDFRTLLKDNFKHSIDEILNATNNILVKSKVHPQIIYENNSFQLQYMPMNTENNFLLTQIAIEVIKLLNSQEYQYLKKCDNHKCSLFFIDTSKNHSRRWCSMEICGNRSKVNSFSKRKKDLSK